MVDVNGPRKCLVLYGSETGNAEDVAHDIGRMVERLHFETEVLEMNAIEIDAMINQSFIIFAISTTGQGDLPSNTQTFWRSLLRKRLASDHFGGLRFTAIGLGDSSYPRFNWAARKLQVRMKQLGARCLFPFAAADDQRPRGIDQTFIPWSADLRKHLILEFPLPHGFHPIPDDVPLPPKWILQVDEKVLLESSESMSLSTAEPVNAEGPFSNGSANCCSTEILPTKRALAVSVKENKRLTPESHWQDVRHLQLVTSIPIKYSPGDTITIFPKNFPEDVEQLISLMGWDVYADIPIEFYATEKSSVTQALPNPPIPNLLPYPHLTIRSLLLNYIDINAIPRRSFFRNVANFTELPLHKERLLEFSNPEYLDDLYDYTTRPRRSILEVLQEFHTVKIPWERLTTVFPVLRGRLFSIASAGCSRDTSPGTHSIELLVAIVKYRTIIRKLRQGVCTRYLASIQPGTTINIQLNKGSFGMTQSNSQIPVIMVSPGTGLAPMRSLIWERCQWTEYFNNQKMDTQPDATAITPVGRSILFFGGRNIASDFFFQQEWELLQKKMRLDVITAFSRDQAHKIYVQDMLRKNSALVYQVLHNESGMIFVCGSSGKMPLAVREALLEIFQREGGMEHDIAQEYLAVMEQDGRYKQETW